MEDEDRPFTVEAARSGVTLSVRADQSLAEALQEAGVDIRLGCRGGGCGTCITPVLAGAVDHRDMYLTAAERDEGLMALCVSRAAGDRLVLDI